MDIVPVAPISNDQIFEIDVNVVPFFQNSYYQNMAGCVNVKILSTLPGPGLWPADFEPNFSESGSGYHHFTLLPEFQQV